MVFLQDLDIVSIRLWCLEESLQEVSQSNVFTSPGRSEPFCTVTVSTGLIRNSHHIQVYYVKNK